MFKFERILCCAILRFVFSELTGTGVNGKSPGLASSEGLFGGSC